MKNVCFSYHFGFNLAWIDEEILRKIWAGFFAFVYMMNPIPPCKESDVIAQLLRYTRFDSSGTNVRHWKTRCCFDIVLGVLGEVLEVFGSFCIDFEVWERSPNSGTQWRRKRIDFGGPGPNPPRRPPVAGAAVATLPPHPQNLNENPNPGGVFGKKVTQEHASNLS